jgi:hypothetical protein
MTGLTELTVICAVGGGGGGGRGKADLPAMWSIAHSMEPVTEGWINGTKTSDHKTLKCQTSRHYYTV